MGLYNPNAFYQEASKSYSEEDILNYDTHMLTQKQKEKDNYAYYKYHHKKVMMLCGQNSDHFFDDALHNRYEKRRLNYRLLNNQANITEIARQFNYFNNFTEVPENFQTQDIISSKIKSLKGLVQKRPHKYSLLAVNPEATSERAEKENQLTRSAVIQEIMAPIQQQVEMQFQEQVKGKQLSQEEQQQLQSQMQQQIEQMTPFSVKKYMNRDFKDSYTILGRDLSDYIKKKINFEKLTNDVAIEHAVADAMCVAYVYEYDGHLQCDIVNNLHFGSSFDEDCIEDCEMAACKYYWSPSKIVKRFNLTDDEIKQVYKSQHNLMANNFGQPFSNTFFTSDTNNDDEIGVEVEHSVWRSLRKYGVLYYLDEQNIVQKMEVDENYKLDKDAGDIKIDWKWDDEIHECWKIGEDIYKNMRPVMFQGSDSFENKKKLPYIGVVFDNLNRDRTSFIDRIKYYYYLYSIIWNKLEGLLASDKGKKLIANINAIPNSQEIDLEKWLYYFKENDIAWFSSAEPGMKYSQNKDARSIFSTEDLSLASDIQKYISLLEFIDVRAGDIIGVPRALQAKTDPDMPVRNMQQNISQSANILEPFLRIHDLFKNNLLLYMVDAAKFIYSKISDKKLVYILDDYSQKIIELNKINKEVLNMSSYGIFTNYSESLLELQQDVQMLLHASMQAQTLDLSAIMDIMKEKDPITQIELAKTYEQEKASRVHKQNLEIEEAKKNNINQEHENEIDKINVEYDRKEQLASLEAQFEQTLKMIEYSSFAENKDFDNDGVPDMLEYVRDGEEADIKKSELQLARDKFEAEKKQKDRELDIKEKEVKKKPKTK